VVARHTTTNPAISDEKKKQIKTEGLFLISLMRRGALKTQMNNKINAADIQNYRSAGSIVW